MTAALMQTPLALLGPQLALSAGLLAALAAGLRRESPAQLLRVLGPAALAAACALTVLSLPGASGSLLRLDGLSLAWQLLFYAGALPLALLPSGEEDGEVRTALLLGSVLGMGLLSASWNLLMIFIGLEFMSLPAYLLVARGASRSAGALEASVKYFFAGGVAGAFFLMGAALYYASSRSLALVGAPGPMAEAGVALMGLAALFKVGAVPLHFWLPDVYEASDAPLAGFLSTAMKAAGILLLMRLAALLPASAFARLLPAAGALTMAAGALMALRQERLQRLLAYSSIAHAGALILGVGAWAAQGAHPAGAAPLYFYLAAYLLMSNGAFFFLAASGLRTRAELRGGARRDPVMAALFGVLLLSLAGIPPTGGFLAKLLVFWEAVKAGLYVPVAVGALAALTALGYYLALVRELFLEDDDEVPRGFPAGRGMERGVVWACAVPSALLGLAPWLLGELGRWLSR